MNHLEQLISDYGYWAVLLGTLAEGETIVVLAGYAAHQGYLDLGGVILAAFAGSFFCDQTIFHIGRRYGAKLLDRKPTWREPAERAFALLRRYQNVYIVGFRFLYGLRTVSPLAIGISRVSALRFLALNALAAAIWAAAIAYAGYLFGNAVEAMLGRARHYEHYVLIAIAAAGFLVWIAYLIRRRIRMRRARQETPT